MSVEQHLRWLEKLCRAPEPPELLRRGLAGQRGHRELEQEVRGNVVVFAQWAASQGCTPANTAARLQLAPRTLRHWQALWREGIATVRPLGRPVQRSPRWQRQEVLEFLVSEGLATGLPTLQAAFPDLGRAELADLLARARRVWQRRYRGQIQVLHWTRPGSVWAMDFAAPPQPIDGLYPYLLAVRDLASGQQLLWLPVTASTAVVTMASLTSLFTIYGAPLVLKSDNGSAFVAEDLAEFLEQWGVLALLSPPRVPSYNGACEAGIGSLKERSERQAERQGRPGNWSWGDVTAAREQANTTARPRGWDGPTPAEMWGQRQALSVAERILFQVAVLQCRNDICRDERLVYEDLRPWQRNAVDRKVMQRALVAHGYLELSRREIPLPIRLAKVANIR